MTEWISCTEKLPPKRVWVKVALPGKFVTAKRCGLFGTGYWKYPSGLVEYYVKGSNFWMSLEDYERIGLSDD
jgi:hypothetical protein